MYLQASTQSAIPFGVRVRGRSTCMGYMYVIIDAVPRNSASLSGV